jgi:hypothetical protein
MKKRPQVLNVENVQDILDDKFRETGLDQVPKRLDILDKILTSVDALVGEVKGYREEQELNANKIAQHDDVLEKHTARIERLDKHLHIAANV